MQTFLGCIGGSVAFVVGIVVTMIARGFALSIMWKWFIVPLFKVDGISIPQALGVSIIIGMLTKSTTADENDKNKSTTYKVASSIIVGIVAPLMTLALAWLVYQFK